MENPIKMDDLGVPLFLETPICFQFLPRKLGKIQKRGGFHQLVTSVFLPEELLEPEELRHQGLWVSRIFCLDMFYPEDLGK